MMALTLSKNLSATLLVLTSFHSFNRLPPYFYYARAAFKLYMLCGCLLIFDGVRRSNFSSEAAQTVWLWSYCLGLPLLSAEICLTAGHLSQFTNVHIILPIYTVLSYHFAPEYVDAYLLGLSHVFSLSCVTILSITTDNVACIAIAIVYYFAQFSEHLKCCATEFHLRLDLKTASRFKDLMALGGRASRIQLREKKFEQCISMCHKNNTVIQSDFLNLILSAIQGNFFNFQILWNWSCCLGLPLISADLCLFPAILPDLTPLHLGIPMYTLIIDHFSPSTVDGHLLSVSQSISICITALLATSGTDLFLRFAFAVVSCMTVLRLSPYGDSDPSYIETWCFVMSVGNLFALQLLKRFRWRD